MLAFFKFIFFVFFSIANAKYFCSGNQTIKIDTEEVAFFETLNFPQMDNDEPCSFTFILNTSVNSNKTRGIFALTNVISGLYWGYLVFKIFDNQYYKNNYFDPSFQGFVVFDDWGSDDCPMETISRINPYHLTDQTQIMQIQSTISDTTKRGHPCLWQFTAPKKFGFKFVIKQLIIASDVLLTIENSTDVIRTQYKARTDYAYYNNDNYLKIYLSHSNHSGFAYNDMEFIAHISIVLKDWKETDIECMTSWDSDMNLTIWSLDNGYPNNAKCELEYTIQSNKQVQFRGQMFAELGVDYFKLIDDKNETIIFTDIVDSWYIGNADGTDKIITGVFISDGSVQSRGFEIQVYERTCGCVEKTLILNCFFTYLIINSDIEDVGQNPFQPYCFNLRCNITIKLDKTCNKSFIIFSIDTQDGPNPVVGEQTSDIYKIFSNGTIVAEINPYTPVLQEYTYFVSTETEIIFELLTTSEDITQHSVSVAASASDGPKYMKQIILSPEAPLFLMNNDIVSENNGYYTVEVKNLNLNKTNTTIEMFSNQGFFGSFYYENFTTVLALDKCEIRYLTYWRCEIPHEKFAVYSEDGSLSFYRLSSTPLRGCVFKKNVFQTFLSEWTITALANSNDTCTIYVLSKKLDIIATHIWTTAKTKNVKVFGGINDDKKLLFEFNAKTASHLKNTILRSPAITIEIPPGSSLFLILDNYETFTIDSFSQIILPSLNYGMISNECDYDHFIFDVNEEQILKFTVFEYTFSSLTKPFFIRSNVGISHENILGYITHVGQEFTFTNISMSLHFYDDNDGCFLTYPQNAGLLLFIEVN